MRVTYQYIKLRKNNKNDELHTSILNRKNNKNDELHTSILNSERTIRTMSYILVY